MKPLAQAWEALRTRLETGGKHSWGEIERSRLMFFWGARAAMRAVRDYEAAVAVFEEIVAFDESIPSLKKRLTKKARVDG